MKYIELKDNKQKVDKKAIKEMKIMLMAMGVTGIGTFIVSEIIFGPVFLK